MFHCVEQTKSEGGSSLWVDGFHAANLLYEEDLESFQILANTPVAFRNLTKTPAGRMYNQSRHTLIRLVIFVTFFPYGLIQGARSVFWIGGA